MEIFEINTDKSPAPYGHYSQAICWDRLIFTATLMPMDPTTKEKSEKFAEQLNQLLNNLDHVLQKAGSSLDGIVRINFYVTDIKNWNELNIIYSKRMKDHKPARGVLEVSHLRHDCLVALDAIAIRQDQIVGL